MGDFLLKDNSQILLLGNKFVKEMYLGQNSIIQTTDTIGAHSQENVAKYINIDGGTYIDAYGAVRLPNKSASAVFNRAFLNMWCSASVAGDLGSYETIYRFIIYKAYDTTTPYVVININAQPTGELDYLANMEAAYDTQYKKTSDIRSWLDGGTLYFNITLNENKQLNITMVGGYATTSLSLSFNVDEYVPLYIKLIKTTTYNSSMSASFDNGTSLDSRNKITYYPQYKTNLI